MKISICGIRGIPASYGGFETFAEQLGLRLLEKGHDVSVYGRSHVVDISSLSKDLDGNIMYNGIKVIILPTIRHKYLDTIVHTLLCMLHMQFHRPDVLLVCNAANGPILIISKITKIRTVINLDGIERKRKKWNFFGRVWYYLGEYTSVWFANRLVSDANVIRNYYLSKHKCESIVIPYGCQETDRANNKAHHGEVNFTQEELMIFKKLGIVPFNYILFVSRLEPENNAHVLIDAYNNLEDKFKNMPLLIVGDAPYAKNYIKMLKNSARENIIFAGYRFGKSYEVLQLGAYIYVQATEVGGTHPALVEAMGFGNCVVVNETPENEEVVEESAVIYKKNSVEDLQKCIAHLLINKEEVARYRVKALNRAKDKYSWDRVTDSYESLFLQMLN